MQGKWISPIRLALNLGEGRDAVRDIIRGKNKNPSAHLILGIARALQTSPAYLLGQTDDPSPDALLGAPAGSMRQQQTLSQVREGYSGADTIPLYGLIQGVLTIGGTPEGHIPRPPALDGIRDAFAVRVGDDSMYPKYESGSLAYAAAGRAPRRGQGCLVEMAPGAQIRRYIRTEGAEVVLEQLNPLAEIRLNLNMIDGLHAILGSWEG